MMMDIDVLLGCADYFYFGYHAACTLSGMAAAMHTPRHGNVFVLLASQLGAILILILHGIASRA